MIPGEPSGTVVIDYDSLKKDGIKASLTDEIKRYFSSIDLDCSELDTLFSITDSIRKEIYLEPFYPEDEIFDTLKHNFLKTAALVSRCRRRMSDLIALQTLVSNTLRKQFRSRHFNRERFIKLYGLMLSGRMAVEEIIIQDKSRDFVSRIRGTDEPSAAPLLMNGGLFLRSGDIVLSLNEDLFPNILLFESEFQGNFSNVSMIYVEDTTRSGFILNSNSGSGSEIIPAGDFFKNIKNRYLVLRVSASDTLLLTDSLIPHKAAKLAFDEMSNNKIKYDFNNKSAGGESLSNAGLVQYYYQILGMKFEIQGIGTSPALFEFSPSLVEVFEVRDQAGLREERLNVLSAWMLANRVQKNEIEDYNIYLLPAARVIKLYSIILEGFGKEGPIPPGMSAGEALRLWTVDNEYKKIRIEMRDYIKKFEEEKGYFPHYKDLLEYIN